MFQDSCHFSLRKVGQGKLTEKLACFGVISYGSIALIQETPKMVYVSISLDMCLPLLPLFIPVTSLVDTATPNLMSYIGVVLGICADAQVLASVVKRVVVPVVNLLTLFRTHDDTVHKDGFVITTV
jgi:hypothetical protein